MVPKIRQKGSRRPRKSWNDTLTENLQNIKITWKDYGEIADNQYCGKIVLPNVFSEHVEGLSLV